MHCRAKVLLTEKRCQVLFLHCKERTQVAKSPGLIRKRHCFFTQPSESSGQTWACQPTSYKKKMALESPSSLFVLCHAQLPHWCDYAGMSYPTRILKGYALICAASLHVGLSAVCILFKWQRLKVKCQIGNYLQYINEAITYPWDPGRKSTKFLTHRVAAKHAIYHRHYQQASFDMPAFGMGI